MYQDSSAGWDQSHIQGQWKVLQPEYTRVGVTFLQKSTHNFLGSPHLIWYMHSCYIHCSYINAHNYHTPVMDCIIDDVVINVQLHLAKCVLTRWPNTHTLNVSACEGS